MQFTLIVNVPDKYAKTLKSGPGPWERQAADFLAGELRDALKEDMRDGKVTMKYRVKGKSYDLPCMDCDKNKCECESIC